MSFPSVDLTREWRCMPEWTQARAVLFPDSKKR
jgi:hypothetical protein